MEQQLREVENRVREEVEEHVRREAEDEMRRQLEEREREIAEEQARWVLTGMNQKSLSFFLFVTLLACVQ